MRRARPRVSELAARERAARERDERASWTYGRPLHQPAPSHASSLQLSDSAVRTHPSTPLIATEPTPYAYAASDDLL